MTHSLKRMNREVRILPLVERGVQVFRHLSAASDSQTLDEIADAIGMSKSGVRPIVAELLASGLIRRVPARRVRHGCGALPHRFIAIKKKGRT